MKLWKPILAAACLAPCAALAQDADTTRQINQAYDWVCSNRSTIEPIIEGFAALSAISLPLHGIGIWMKRSGVTGTVTWAGKLFKVIRAMNGDVPPPPAVIATQGAAILSDPVKGPAVLAAIKDDPVAKQTVIAGALATSALSKS